MLTTFVANSLIFSDMSVSSASASIGTQMEEDETHSQSTQTQFESNKTSRQSTEAKKKSAQKSNARNATSSASVAVQRGSVFPLSWVIKRDIRKDYPTMWINVSNHYDRNLLSKFFEEFCTPGCRYVAELPFDTAHTSRVRRSKNRAELIAQILHDSSFFPDLSFRLMSMKIVQRKGYVGSQVVIRAQFKGTVIREDKSYDMPKSNKLCIHQQNLLNALQGGNSVCSEGSVGTVPVEGFFEDHDLSSPVLPECLLCKRFEEPLLATPVEVCYTPVATMYLDEFHRMYCLEFSPH